MRRVRPTIQQQLQQQRYEMLCEAASSSDDGDMQQLAPLCLSSSALCTDGADADIYLEPLVRTKSNDSSSSDEDPIASWRTGARRAASHHAHERPVFDFEILRPATVGGNRRNENKSA